MNKKQKKALAQIISAVVLLAVISLVTGKVSVSPYVEFVLYMVPYLLVGYDILKKALKGIKNKQVFDENFLMAVATLGAIALGDTKRAWRLCCFTKSESCFRAMPWGEAEKISVSLWISARIMPM